MCCRQLVCPFCHLLPSSFPHISLPICFDLLCICTTAQLTAWKWWIRVCGYVWQRAESTKKKPAAVKFVQFMVCQGLCFAMHAATCGFLCVCVCACSRLGVSDWKHFRNLTIVSRAQDGHASFTDPPACVFVYRFWPHAAIFSQKVLFAELRSLHACKQTCHPPNRTHTHPHSLPVLFSACPHHCVIFLFPAWSLTLFLFCLFLF